MMSEKRFEYDKCTGIKDLSIDEDDDQFLYPTQIVDLLNELATNCSQLQEENEQLKSYIDTIFEGNTHICKKLDIEDVQFYCQRNRDYRFPTCTYAKCFDEENLIEVKEEIRKCFDE